MKLLTIEEVHEDGRMKSYSSFIIEDNVVYVYPIHGFNKDKVGEIDEHGNIRLVLKPI